MPLGTYIVGGFLSLFPLLRSTPTPGFLTFQSPLTFNFSVGRIWNKSVFPWSSLCHCLNFKSLVPLDENSNEISAGGKPYHLSHAPIPQSTSDLPVSFLPSFKVIAYLLLSVYQKASVLLSKTRIFTSPLLFRLHNLNHWFLQLTSPPHPLQSELFLCPFFRNYFT